MIRIAIDGPGGAGKSSVAKAVAKRLGIIYVDTGALYRTIGVYMLSRGVDPKNEEEVSPLLSDLSIELKFTDRGQIIMLNGNEVGDEIRTPEASMAASAVSALGTVRSFLLNTQRDMALKNSVIMDGRDIGTVILPNAEVKIFLTASPEARAKRRFAELTAKGIDTTYEKVYEEMAERDRNDSTRAIAPCVPANDAVTLDNSNINFEQTVDRVISIVKKAEKKRRKRGTAFYMTCRTIVYPIFSLFNRFKVIGKENIPKDGGALVCCNHIGIKDIFLLGLSSPRQLYFLAKKEAFSIPFIKHIMRWLGALELDRGGKDVGALKNAVSAINGGKLVMIFPQGHRCPGKNPAETNVKSGAGLIAYHAKTKVIPICIKTRDVRYKFLRKTEVIIGKPIEYSDLEFDKGGFSEYKVATDKVFAEICSLGGYTASDSFIRDDANEN